MLKETVILVLVSLVAIGCLYFLVPYTIQYTYSKFFHPIAAYALVGFIGLMCLSGLYIKRLYGRNQRSALIFSVILLVVIVFSAVILYWWIAPLMVPKPL